MDCSTPGFPVHHELHTGVSTPGAYSTNSMKRLCLLPCKYSLWAVSRKIGVEEVQRSPGAEADVPALRMKVDDRGCCPRRAGRDLGAHLWRGLPRWEGRGRRACLCWDRPATGAHGGRAGVPGELGSGREGAGCGGNRRSSGNGDLGCGMPSPRGNRASGPISAAGPRKSGSPGPPT